MLPLVLASAGALLLYRILARLRPGAALQDAVVVITGASSGLGKGWPPVHFIFTPACAFHKSSFLDANVLSNEQSSIVSMNETCFFCVTECARVFHAAGARLVLCGRDAGRLQQVVQELTGSSTGSHRRVCALIHLKSNILKPAAEEKQFLLPLQLCSL